VKFFASANAYNSTSQTGGLDRPPVKSCPWKFQLLAEPTTLQPEHITYRT